MLFYEKKERQAHTRAKVFTKEAPVPTTNKEPVLNINTYAKAVARGSSNNSRAKMHCLSLSKKRKATLSKVPCRDTNLSMSTSVGPVTDAAKTKEFTKEDSPHPLSPTITSNSNSSMSSLTPEQESTAEKNAVSSSETNSMGPAPENKISTTPNPSSPPIKMHGCDENSTNDIIITKITKLPTSSAPDKEQQDITIKVTVPPDYYVPIGFQSAKPGLFKTRIEGNVVHSNMYLSLTGEERKRAQETAIAGVHISVSDRVKEWDPTDIIRLLPASHKISDSLLSNFLVNKIFLMIEEEAVKQGKQVHTCNMEVLQRMTEPSLDIFLKCKYDQLYPHILDSEVILCPSLHADHWCLVAVYPAIKRMVYLDSLFQGIGAKRAFQRVGNFIECAMKLQGQKYSVDEWDFFAIPANDVEQQLNSVDCGVFVVKWAQHIAEGRMIDFKQRHINDFRYSLILDIAGNKLSCLSIPLASSKGSNSCEQTANSDADPFKSSPTENSHTILQDHCYSLATPDNIPDDIPERTNAYVLPQHVQSILPPTAVYKCLEYEELSNDDTMESKKYRVKFNIKDVSTPKEIEKWVSQFAASSNIKYNSQGGYKRKGVRVSFAQWYICECKRKTLSRNQKEAKAEAMKRRQERHCTHAANAETTDKIHLLSNIRDKKTDCESKMVIKVRTKAVEEIVCDVELWWNHNHSVNCHHLTTFSQILPATRHKFLTYFEQGMSASESFHHHETTLMRDPVTVLLLADRKYCPSLRDVNNLYEKWRKTTKGPCNGTELFDYLQEYITTYNKDKVSDGGKIFLQRYNNDEKREQPLIISICTPMMSRVHKLRQAGEMAFMDASGSLDRHNNPVYFMCTHHPSGALPLAVWITSSQSESTLNSCLHSVVSVLPRHAFGGKGVASGPSIFLTDDDSAQRNALRAYWHSSVLLLCIFHFLQAVWRWLLDSTNSINKMIGST
ncbi:uncharacterized protein LOC114535014 [Dendronephthya gigantea]|uniref:uncharacterized protein LOC114535014 n=1 Tax=Dendronephthya gigantea TaxID=151771 RepID=UPI00106B016C|nr:uncharacterized protein LOC114535014 [Dendronephthya gigantea]